MSVIPEIITDRLYLRGFVRADAEDVFNYASDPAVLLYTTGRTPQSVNDSQAFVDSLLAKPAGAYAWAIRLTGMARVIGAVEFGVGDGGTGAIDYALAREFWNRGLMTEACTAVLDWGFGSHPGLDKVTTSAVSANRGSSRVMEKCGMVFRGTARDTWDKFTQPVELAIYSIDRKQWDSRRRGPADEGEKSRR